MNISLPADLHSHRGQANTTNCRKNIALTEKVGNFHPISYHVLQEKIFNKFYTSLTNTTLPATEAPVRCTGAADVSKITARNCS